MDKIQGLVTGLPRLSKTIACGLSASLLIGVLFPSSQSVFALNIAKTFPYLWNIVTSGYFELYLFTGITNIVMLLFAGKFLEPIWGSKEFMRFIMVVNLGAGIGAFLLMLILYAITFDTNKLYNSNLCGFSGVIAAFSVALKQLLPEQEVQFFYVIPVRMKQMPGLIFLSTITLFLLNLYPSHHLPHVLFGVLSSWIYLRFYQKKGEVIGDMSNEFAFYTFFPDPIQPFVRIVGKIIYKITYVPLRFVGAVPQRTRPVLPTDEFNQLLSTTVVSTNTNDIERRRMLAAKALDARIQSSRSSLSVSSESSSPPESPSLSQSLSLAQSSDLLSLSSLSPLSHSLSPTIAPLPSAPALDNSSELSQSQ